MLVLRVKLKSETTKKKHESRNRYSTRPIVILITCLHYMCVCVGVHDKERVNVHESEERPLTRGHRKDLLRFLTSLTNTVSLQNW